MTYRDVNLDQLDHGLILGHGNAQPADDQPRAGWGACWKCGCTAFESGGSNSEQCGNSSCAHAWSDHG